jgi:prolipoprotein diacylglyceryl transferase
MTSLVYFTVAIVVGARLGHCLFYQFDRVMADPLYLFKVWRGGLSSHGVGVAIIITLFLVARKHGMPVSEVGDRFSFSVAWGAILVRVGNFMNSEIVGRPTDGTWGVRFPQYDKLPIDQVPLRHPSQLYEVFLGVSVLVLLLVVDRIYGERRRQGLLSGLFLTTCFLGRFFVEFFKEHQALDPKSFLTMGQWLSIPFFLFGAAWLVKVYRRPAVVDHADAGGQPDGGDDSLVQT